MTSTVKLVDYGKYMYQKSKDDKEKRKTQKPTVLKEIKINYAIGENDLQMKIKKAIEFLKERYNVKFFIKLKGREKIYANKAIEKLVKIKGDLADYGKSQFETPKQEAQGYSIILFSK
jgi:translation initiation factor IF-3